MLREPPMPNNTIQNDEAERDNLIARLIERYTPPTIPPCRVCGAALAIAACGGGKPTKYACSSQQLGNGKPFDWDHYGASEWEDRRQGGDPDVLELIEFARSIPTAAAVPEGWRIVPTKITREMIEAGLAAHYGKRRMEAAGGAGGISMTVDGRDHDGITAMRNFWKGALAAAPAPSQGDASAREADRDLMLWQSDDTEVYANGPDDFAEDYARNCLRVGEQADVRVDCAYHAKSRTIRISVIDKGDDESEVMWEWVAAAHNQALQEGQ